MRHAHIGSGGRYPVLRSLALIYLVIGVLTLIGGIIAAIWELTAAPEGSMGIRLRVALFGLAATFLASLFVLGFAEMIKLFIDIEHNTRMGGQLPSGVAALPPDGKTGRTWLEGEETAEGALLRGH